MNKPNGGFLGALRKLFIIATSSMIVIGVIYSAIAFVLMVAWNFVVPSLFGLPTLQFTHALALTILLGIISLFLRGRVKKG